MGLTHLRLAAGRTVELTKLEVVRGAQLAAVDWDLHARDCAM